MTSDSSPSQSNLTTTLNGTNGTTNGTNCDNVNQIHSNTQLEQKLNTNEDLRSETSQPGGVQAESDQNIEQDSGHIEGQGDDQGPPANDEVTSDNHIYKSKATSDDPGSPCSLDSNSWQAQQAQEEGRLQMLNNRKGKQKLQQSNSKCTIQAQSSEISANNTPGIGMEQEESEYEQDSKDQSQVVQDSDVQQNSCSIESTPHLNLESENDGNQDDDDD